MAIGRVENTKARNQIVRTLRKFADRIESGKDVVTEWSVEQDGVETALGLMPTGAFTTTIRWSRQLTRGSLNRRRR